MRGDGSGPHTRPAPKPDHYGALGVAADATQDELRAAYRAKARDHHPDAQGASAETHEAMAALNQAWYTLSDPKRRQAYDNSLKPPVIRPPAPPPPPDPARPKPAPGARREAWLDGIRTQMVRLGNQAGRSSTMNLSLPTGRDRPRYAALLEPIIDHIAQDTAPRIREARALGAAPLDLGVVAALVGLRSYADLLEARIRKGDLDDDVPLQAALVDRMWDVMAHEVPHDITMDLGGSPHLARILQPSSPRRRRGRKS